MRVIGLMSGTSLDAIDAAAADLAFEGDALVLTPLGSLSVPYSDELGKALAAALPPAATTMEEVCRLDTRVGQEFAAVAVRADRELCDGRADLVVSHGQTVFHWVEDGRVHGTLQIGRPAWIAEAAGCPVVSDLRTRDVAAGGQGAPLVSIVDVLWLRGRPGVPVALNLGGIANITVAAGDPVAFDTGPANALIDAAVRDLTHGAADYDADGALAARGSVDASLLERLLDEPYYARPAPRTTGKELFHLPYLRAALAGGPPLPAEDVVATLTRLTARTVADAARSVGATEVIASGGGTRNPVLMAMLRTELDGIGLRVSDDLGLPSEAKEAYAFAVLGFLTLHGLPGTVPACTGARHAGVLGSITPGRRGLRLPETPRSAPSRLRIAPGPSDASGAAVSA
ncbi:anhydro-N-acetylmuramic acid kinase [Streptomyces sp. NPDC047108]|uniref:anhydro-N-acetylmuramic acid kinase n=1 Tax=Streptomyces sp. NPDC047108 TaxID=3155025 RepID=UPI0034015FCF